MKPLAIVGLICGVIAFVFFPPIFGILGIILSAVATKDHEAKPLATAGLYVSVAGLALGMVFGVLMYAT